MYTNQIDNYNNQVIQKPKEVVILIEEKYNHIMINPKLLRSNRVVSKIVTY